VPVHALLCVMNNPDKTIYIQKGKQMQKDEELISGFKGMTVNGGKCAKISFKDEEKGGGAEEELINFFKYLLLGRIA